MTHTTSDLLSYRFAPFHLSLAFDEGEDWSHTLDESEEEDTFALALIADPSIININRETARALTPEKDAHLVARWGQDLERIAFDMGRASRVLAGR